MKLDQTEMLMVIQNDHTCTVVPRRVGKSSFDHLVDYRKSLLFTISKENTPFRGTSFTLLPLAFAKMANLHNHSIANYVISRLIFINFSTPICLSNQQEIWRDLNMEDGHSTFHHLRCNIV